MLVISKNFKFEAAHQLIHHDGICQRLHGHSYHFKLEVRGAMKTFGPKRNMVLDYSDLSIAGKEIENQLDHRFLNEIFNEEMPTAEYISEWIFLQVSKTVPDLWAVEVSETESTSCRFCPTESRLIELGWRELLAVRSRLYEKIQVGSPDECWPFLGSTDDEGYGYCSYSYAGTNKAHRLVKWLDGFDIDGMIIRHSCDNPPCCNGSHLIVGTHEENEQDKDDRGRRPIGDKHTNAILSDDEVREIWQLFIDNNQPKGFSAWAAPGFGVSVGVISNIVKGWSWNHITGLPKRYRRIADR